MQNSEIPKENEEMPANEVDVKIELTGLALCFFRDPVAGGTNEIWNIAFLCDSKHPLILSINDHSAQTPQKPTNWRPTREDIIVEVTGTTGTGADKGEVHRLLNMSSNRYGHGSRNSNLSNLDIKRVANPTADLVWLRVPNASMEVPRDNREDTMIVRTEPDFGVPKRVPDRGKLVRLIFTVAGSFDLVLKQYPSGDPLPAPHDRPIRVVADPNAGSDVELTFNNECGGCTRNDFIDLYEFVDHRQGGDRYRFMSWAEDAESQVIVLSMDDAERRNQKAHIKELCEKDWEMVGDQNGPEIEIRRKKFMALFAELHTSAYGNCDPVSSDPPPGGP